MKLFVISDDLTGGAAVAGELAVEGYRGYWMKGGQSIVDHHFDFLLYNTESRNLGVVEATQANQVALKRALSFGHPGVYIKKIDSLLRGHIGPELETCMDILEAEAALVVPASPSVGRVTKAGIQYVNGRPLEEIMPRLDPFSRKINSNVVEWMAGTTRRPVSLLPLEVIRDSRKKTEKLLQEGLRNGNIVVSDAETSEDMQRVVSCALESGYRVIAGTYGIGKAIALALGKKTEQCGSNKKIDSFSQSKTKPLPVLTVIGTLSNVAEEQIDYCTKQGTAQLLQVVFDPLKAVTNLSEWKEEWIHKAKTILDKGSSLLFKISPPWSRRQFPPSNSSAFPAALEMVKKMFDGLAADVGPALFHSISGLVLTGGETAQCVLDVEDIQLVEIEPFELEPGIPLMRIKGGPYDGLRFLTKPGSYGSKETLHKAICFLSRFGVSAL